MRLKPNPDPIPNEDQPLIKRPRSPFTNLPAGRYIRIKPSRIQSSSFFEMSEIHSETPVWAAGWVQGVGRVPGGPRVRTRTTLAGDVEVQIATGSTVLLPRVEELELDSATPSKLEALQEVSSSTPGIDQVVAYEMDPQREQKLPDAIVKVEDAVDDPPDFPEDFENHFARLIAANNLGSRSGSGGSQRQEVYEGPMRDRTERRHTTTLRNRSRSPRTSRQSTRSLRATESPMFFPEALESHDSGIGTMGDSTGPQSGGGTTLASLSMRATPAHDPPLAWEIDEPESFCMCPISYNCSHRRANLVDCRLLVPEKGPNWDERDQEKFDK